jgi:hypothetical protein
MIARVLPLEGLSVAVYAVYEPPEPRADRLDRAESLAFVKEGFSWPAALFAPLWLLVKRLWVAFVAYVVAVSALGFGLAALDTEHWTGFALIAVHVLIGFEADTLRRRKLERRGWRLVGTVTGPNLVDCERRFFEDWLPRQPVLDVGVAGDASSPEHGREPGRRRWRALFGRA